MKIRKPAVAGRFYPGTKKEIIKQLNEIMKQEQDKIDYPLGNANIIGGIVPHAGYMFSAYQAVHFYEILKQSEQKFDTFIIINPNHTGYGEGISIDSHDEWETPLGDVEVDTEFRSLTNFTVSSEAHQFEHSGEVQVPMLQHFLSNKFQILPITMSVQDIENARTIAKTIFTVNKQLGKNICILASSDFSHFMKPEEGRKLDRLVINEILGLNALGVQKEVKGKNISVCGFGPIMTLIEYSKLVSGTPKAIELKVGNSGEIIPSNEVVGYASMIFTY
ncbi:MAG: AmmeMemoRadiSam system protein B [Bacteroidetes bacterium]|nr:MAG: AmmeMemoRadiSam system protein B [Bacteroidota bacterium]